MLEYCPMDTSLSGWPQVNPCQAMLRAMCVNKVAAAAAAAAVTLCGKGGSYGRGVVLRLLGLMLFPHTACCCQVHQPAAVSGGALKASAC